MDRGALWIVLAVFLITLFLGLILIDRLLRVHGVCPGVSGRCGGRIRRLDWPEEVTPIRLYSAKEDFDYEFGTYHCP